MIDGTLLDGMTPADWEPYRGNNHLRIGRPATIYQGAICFGSHLGRPLSQRLWEDLVHRVVICGLCVYAHNGCQWTLGWGEGHCNLQLDEAGNVTDIELNPYRPN